MTKDEALNLALDALKKIYEGCGNVIEDPLHENAVTLAKLVREDCNKPITAIHEALARPEQEPDDLTIIAYMSGFYDGKNKYAPRRTWVGLTEEEIDRLNFIQVGGCQCSLCYIDGIEEFAKSIEAKLREKNG